MSFETSVSAFFSAAHAIVGMGGSCEKMHGHNWKVEVFVTAKELDERGLSIDYRELQALLTEALATLDHSVLNELPQFSEVSPTSENLAKYIFDSLIRHLPARHKLKMVRVSESESTAAAYRP